MSDCFLWNYLLIFRFFCTLFSILLEFFWQHRIFQFYLSWTIDSFHPVQLQETIENQRTAQTVDITIKCRFKKQILIMLRNCFYKTVFCNESAWRIIFRRNFSHRHLHFIRIFQYTQKTTSYTKTIALSNLTTRLFFSLRFDE